MGMTEIRDAIVNGKTALGIEFGSTRIKAVLVGEDNTPIAAGNHEWENRYENNIWTYSLEDIWNGLQDSYQEMAASSGFDANTLNMQLSMVTSPALMLLGVVITAALAILGTLFGQRLLRKHFQKAGIVG